MKADYFLAVPLAATLLNIAVLLIVLHHSSHHVEAQPAIINELLVVRSSGPQECLFDANEHVVALNALEDTNLNYTITDNDDNDDEDNDDDYVGTFVQQRDLMSSMEQPDPMLKRMPGVDFNAYVRADISSFYQEEPGSLIEVKPAFSGQAGKFINMSPFRVTLYWMGHDGPQFNSNLGPWESGGTACFPGHEFIFAKPYDPNEVYCRFQVTEGTSVYYYDPFTSNDGDDAARGEIDSDKVLELENLSSHDRQMYRAHKYNLQFGAMYKNFTGGSEWLSMYPRDPPRHPVWRADYFGQEHHVRTVHNHFLKIPPGLNSMDVEQMKRANETNFAAYRLPGMLSLTLKAISCAPRAFAIDNFVSEIEADHLLELVEKRNDMIRSTTDGHLSESRTSTTTWLPRHSDAVIDAIFRRAADVLRIDEALLRQRLPGEHDDMPSLYGLNEDLQIVHYDKGQQYTAHHDFGFPKGQPNSPSRSINLCMYLNDVTEGGQTSFPRWRNTETSGPINMIPKKGTAMIFYMVNPDGNLDDLTHHAALPVIEGEKWFSNLWIWDPVRL